jgi:signal transduction histidine kinase
VAARPPSRAQARAAWTVLAGLLVIFLVVAPFAALPLPHVTAAIPVWATAMVFIDLTTAALMFAQFWVVRWTWLLLLACGFFFTGLIAIPYGLAFPEGFAPSGLLGANAQTAAQLSLCSHLASPLVLIAAILVRDLRPKAGTWQGAPGLAIVFAIVLTAAIAGALTWTCITNDRILPRIYVNSLHSNLALLIPVIALKATAFALLLARGRSVLDLWLMVMSGAWVFDLSLAVLANSRYNLGWYTGRFFQVQAVFAVLLLFLSEQTALYAGVARAAIQRRGARDARQIAMDVMAASIGHEIKQPLTAVIANAQAGMSQLRNAEPADIGATFSDIAADGQRILDILDGVRAMFMASVHRRQAVDVNKLLRDVLAAADLDLRGQRVTVKTELDDGLVPVMADSGQLHQVFLNLVTNAIEAMATVRDRPALLRITSAMASSNVAVTVEDSGIGMPNKDSARLLEPFHSTKPSGTGVGLTICRVFIRAHGGSLSIGANKPHGTVIHVILPSGGED